MWKLKIPINFITLHYAWIIFMGLLSLLVIYPNGNLAAVDAYFFGASASTESGLNTVDVKDLKTYQQLYIYFIPIFTNLGFINIVVVAVRLHWFEKRLRDIVRSSLRSGRSDIESASGEDGNAGTQASTDKSPDEEQAQPQPGPAADTQLPSTPQESRRLTFATDVNEPGQNSTTIYVPSQHERDNGHSLVERDTTERDVSNRRSESESIRPVEPDARSLSTRRRMGHAIGRKSIEKAASSFLAPGGISNRNDNDEDDDNGAASPQEPRRLNIAGLSVGVTVGRNSRIYGLTAEDRDKLGGIEYRSLKLLLKIVSCYFFGIHIFGAICLLPWIHNAPAKYTDYLQEIGQDKTWWAFYSAQTMVDNLGFTLTPDSMIHFRDAAWPMLVMSFLAFAGNTLYPVFLRLAMWIMYKCAPSTSSTRETLGFILEHPRRCYTLLFPSTTTWVLAGIISMLNFIDVLLIIFLDLDNTEVNVLPVGSRILAAIFQAASARHTGTATFNLALVNPGVQFSLLVMMYIAILPIAISIRSSNTYEEKALGFYHQERGLSEAKSTSYLMTHIRNQLAFDLWYIFLGTFLVCCAEAPRIMDGSDPAFAVFPVFFEIVSAYGNVGLSLGHPTVATSLSGQFTVFSKVVVCLVMIRGRHRALPYALDRAIMLPGGRFEEDELLENDVADSRNEGFALKKYHTS